MRLLAPVAALGLLLLPVTAAAQAYRGPEPAPEPAPIAVPLDTPYGGVIALTADVTDTVHRVIDVHETIPVHGPELTLLYPQWIPGNHSPTGPISKLAGLEVTANGQRIPWVRDRVNVYAFHITVPAGVTAVAAHYEYLAPVLPNEGRVSFDANLLDLSWNTVALYPAGHFSRDISFEPTVKLPAGWQYATALATVAKDGDAVHFARTTLNTLIDSPLYAGVNYERLDLSSSPDNQVFLNVFADTPAELVATPEELQMHKQLVVEAAKLFGSHHYTQYNFLLTLSNTIGGEGLEHHQSSEDGTNSRYFTNWAGGLLNADLLAHEYTHSWNGKFRRPYDLWTPNFNVPMQDDLLWVYEGLTQYWGYVLTARAGMRTPDETRELIARLASGFEDSQGRDWRALLDTTNQPTMSQRAPVPWTSWTRAEDYYTEGLLVWLDADTKIRQLSQGKKSLDNFARSFYGMDNGSFVTRTYTFDQLVAAMNAVAPYDWATFFRQRVDRVDSKVPENGITQGGYKLVYNDTEPEWMRLGRGAGLNLGTGLGFSVTTQGMVANVWWGTPGYSAGLVPATLIMSVNGQPFSPDALRAAVVAAETSTTPIQLGIRRDGVESTITLDYHAGLRFPNLERVAGTPDYLDAILQP